MIDKIDFISVWISGLDFKKKLILSYKQVRLQNSFEKLGSIKNDLYRSELGIDKKYSIDQAVFESVLELAVAIVSG